MILIDERIGRWTSEVPIGYTPDARFEMTGVADISLLYEWVEFERKFGSTCDEQTSACLLGIGRWRTMAKAAIVMKEADNIIRSMNGDFLDTS